MRNNNSGKGKKRRTRSKAKSQNNALKRDDDQVEERVSKDHRSNDDRGRADRLSSLNDISWYNRYPELLTAASRIPFPWRPGMTMDFGTITSSGASPKTLPITESIPGVLRLSWMPTIGYSDDVTSPASIACKEIYAKVRQKYSGSLEADPPDFMIYLMALDSIFAYIATLKRVFRVIDAYTPNNYVLPQILAYALGISSNAFTDLQNNKMQLFQCINELIHMSAKFTCPAVMDIFNRHYWLNDNVYADAPSENAQLYVFYQAYYYQYATQNTPQGEPAGGLILTRPASFTVSNLFTYGRGLISALSEWDDSYTISGYLMRAYEGYPTFKVDLLEYNERLSLAYVPEVLSQIENFTFVPGAAANYESNVVSQDPTRNIVICKPMVPKDTAGDYFTWNMTNLSPAINIHAEMVNEQAVVIATRMKGTLSVQPNADGNYRVICGTEIPLSLDMWDGAGTISNILQYIFLQSNVSTAAAWQHWLNMVKLRKFDWAPMVYLVYADAALEKAGIVTQWEYQNGTLISKQDLENMHRICIYSEFNAFTE